MRGIPFIQLIRSVAAISASGLSRKMKYFGLPGGLRLVCWTGGRELHGQWSRPEETTTKRSQQPAAGPRTQYIFSKNGIQRVTLLSP